MKPAVRAVLLAAVAAIGLATYAVYDQIGARRPALTPVPVSEGSRQGTPGSDAPVRSTSPAEVVLQGGVSTRSIDPNRFIDPDSNYYTGNGEIVHVGKFRDPARIEPTSESTVVIEVGELPSPNDAMRSTPGSVARVESIGEFLDQSIRTDRRLADDAFHIHVADLLIEKLTVLFDMVHVEDSFCRSPYSRKKLHLHTAISCLVL